MKENDTQKLNLKIKKNKQKTSKTKKTSSS